MSDQASGGDENPAAAVTKVVEATETVDGAIPVLRLRKIEKKSKESLKKKVSWTTETVDNEGLGKKKSKCCCIYVKPKQFGESDTESEGENSDCDNCSGHKPKQGPNVERSSSSSEGEEETEKLMEKSEEEPRERFKNPFLSSAVARLGRPSYMQEVEDVTAENLVKVSDDSVFSNPFKAREDKKKAILERHVEMTTKPEEMKTIRGKKVCWNFRKGRCRFGSKCTFAHDSDIMLMNTARETEGAKDQPQSSQPKKSNFQLLGRQDDETGSSSAVISHNKRKRPGLSDSLVPGKKAMKLYNKLYSKDT